MDSLTIEFQRFGESTGIIRGSDRYIRTVGTVEPAEEVAFPIPQEILDSGMDTLDYRRFKRGGDELKKVTEVAEDFIRQIEPYLKQFLLGGRALRKRKTVRQIDIVTHALELAQLPFEILEEEHEKLIITRRIRQKWPPPKVNRGSVPKVLFAWAEPRKSKTSRRRMEVPHDRHLELFDKLLADWGGALGPQFCEIGNATLDKLEQHLTKTHNYTHIHLLAHGIGPSAEEATRCERVNLKGEPAPTTFVALENEDGSVHHCPPVELARLVNAVPRPETFVFATCHSAEVDPVRAAGTLAHLLHCGGVPIVLASQLALTEAGSDELIDTFLAKVIDGRDPRTAVRACRDALRDNKDTTFYDRVALVSYVHIGEDLAAGLVEKQFQVALTRIESTSNKARRQMSRSVRKFNESKQLTADDRAEVDQIRERFEEVRQKLGELENRPDIKLTGSQIEELRGLQASSLKREAQVAWELSCSLPGEAADEWIELSRKALAESADAYRRAAGVSRDNHWTWVQWLVLEAVRRGSLLEHKVDWITAKAAAFDAASRATPRRGPRKDRAEIAKAAIWGWGSLCELHLLAPAVDGSSGKDEAMRCLKRMVGGCKRLDFKKPIESTRAQLARYGSWWGADEESKLPPEVVENAKELHAFLEAHC